MEINKINYSEAISITSSEKNTLPTIYINKRKKPEKTPGYYIVRVIK